MNSLSNQSKSTTMEHSKNLEKSKGRGEGRTNGAPSPFCHRGVLLRVGTVRYSDERVHPKQ